MSAIEENTNKVGYGSWYVSQIYGDYKDKMTQYEFQCYIQDQCLRRIRFLNIKKGDHISLTYIGGNKSRKFTGVVTTVHIAIYIQQKSREVSFDICLVDEIEKLDIPKKESKDKVVLLSGYRK